MKNRVKRRKENEFCAKMETFFTFQAKKMVWEMGDFHEVRVFKLTVSTEIVDNLNLSYSCGEVSSFVFLLCKVAGSSSVGARLSGYLSPRNSNLHCCHGFYLRKWRKKRDGEWPSDGGRG